MTTPEQRVKKLESDLARLKHPTSAGSLVAALARKHADDIFVVECKDGPTQTGTHRRLDAWVLKKTWSPITMIGYEVKVSRSDWLSDKKLIAYLPLCHYLYMVAPKDLIALDELPSGVGLLEPVGDGARLATRRKATWRDIELPTNLLVYVLMCRVTITREQQQNAAWRLDQLKHWVDGKVERRELSYAVNKKIREKFIEQEHRFQLLEQRTAAVEQVKQRIIELGFDPDKPFSLWQVSERIKELAGAVDQSLITALETTERALADARERLLVIYHKS